MTVKADENKAIPVDEQFLQDYLAKGGKVTDASSGKELDTEDLDALLTKDVDTHKASTDKELNAALLRGEKRALQEKKEAEQKQLAEKRRIEKLQQKTEQADAADQARLQREQEQAEQEQAAKLKRDNQQTASGVRSAVGNVGSTLNENINPILDRIGGARTVGGIGLLLAILLFLQLALVQVNENGDTRLKQLWFMLNGKATLQGRVGPIQGSQGASGNFGTGTTSPTTTPVSPTTPNPILNFSSNGSYRSYTSLN